MKAGGQSQQWLADILNLSRATINRWETKGAGSATLDELEIISRILQAPLDELLGLPKEKPGSARAASLAAIVKQQEEELEIKECVIEDLTKEIERALQISRKSKIPEEILSRIEALSPDALELLATAYLPALEGKTKDLSPGSNVSDDLTSGAKKRIKKV